MLARTGDRGRIILVRGEFGGLYGESRGSGFRRMEGRGESSQAMSSKGIGSSVEPSTCCILALKVVGDVLVIDVGYKMYLKLVSVGNKVTHANSDACISPLFARN